MNVNILDGIRDQSTQSTEIASRLAAEFRVLGQPARIDILLAIGRGEACVCHLEAVLGLRQAYISQHLMALREAGMITSRRDGRYIYHRLARPELLDMIRHLADITGVDVGDLSADTAETQANCACPQCKPELEAVG